MYSALLVGLTLSSSPPLDPASFLELGKSNGRYLPTYWIRYLVNCAAPGRQELPSPLHTSSPFLPALHCAFPGKVEKKDGGEVLQAASRGPLHLSLSCHGRLLLPWPGLSTMYPSLTTHRL